MVRKQICAGIQKVKCTMRISTISYRIGQGIEMEQREREGERERERNDGQSNVCCCQSFHN